MINEKVFKIFIDFDGTITKVDVGEWFTDTFGDPAKNKEIIKLWVEDKITSPESWYLMFENLHIDKNKFDEFIAAAEIDQTFKNFINYCRQNNFEVRVLSDGFDIYINKIFEKENLADLEVYCNTAIVDKENKLIPIFPYGDEECKSCGNCKRNHILSNSGDDDYIIYIGDGYSDKCPVQYCDFIFAKNSLLKYCELNRITYFPFKNFDEVRFRLEELNCRKRLKKKFQAAVKRKEVFLQG
jgi:2-hydroxy-3-keto-5-methylthiopentenyl-1-phosphate phosphatase